MKIVSLNLLEDNIKDNKVLALAPLLFDYFKECHKDILVGDEKGCINMLYSLMTYNSFIYYVEEDEAIKGFVTMSTNNQHDMVEPHLLVDYMYVIPEARGGKAIALLSGISGYVADTLEMNILCTTFIDSSNISNIKLLKGIEVATVFVGKREDFRSKCNKYIRKYIQ